jgi:hypothetical protein
MNRDRKMRQRLAIEAARMMAEESIGDFLTAKRKAATLLGVTDTRNLPRNSEVEEALVEYQRLFKADSQPRLLRELREVALQAMHFLESFKPHLTGSVLRGTASYYSDINLHLFATTPEEVSLFLMQKEIPFDMNHKRFRFSKDASADYPIYRFVAGKHSIELTVFPINGERQAPLSPVDGRPMQRASASALQRLLEVEAV